MVFLKTDRLVLRNVSSKDLQTMFDYRNNEICARYQRGQTKDREGIAKLLQRRREDTLSLTENCLIAVASKETDELLGEIVLMPSENTFSLGYTFSYRHHGKGYAYEAVSALMELLHIQYPDWEFICFTDPRNMPSRNLLLKLGYRDAGYLPARDSQVFTKWTTPQTDEELAQIVE